MKTTNAIIEDIYNEALAEWRLNKGVGSANIPEQINRNIFIVKLIDKMLAKNDKLDAIIMVTNGSVRRGLIEDFREYSTNKSLINDKLANRSIKLYTPDFVKLMKSPPHGTLCIYHYLTFMSYTDKAILESSKFKLVLLGKNVTKEASLYLNKNCQPLVTFNKLLINDLRTTTPVEEMRCPVSIPADTEEYKLLSGYNNYISTSLAIFGTFEVMNNARVGVSNINMSAAQVCEQIAKDNGWNDHLDMSIELNRKIDILYNPNNIADRATKTYEIIRKRIELLSEYKGKLDVIKDIVASCEPTDKILIINKKAVFAKKVTDYLNSNFGPIAGDFHNFLNNEPAIDLLGNPIYYKSGSRKGERKFMGHTAQSTRNNELFNLDRLRVLTTGQAPDKSLMCRCDVVIITSPFCEELNNYIYRLDNVEFNSEKLKLFTIYVENSIEETKLQQIVTPSNYTIIENKNSLSDEKNLDFIIAD